MIRSLLFLLFLYTLLVWVISFYLGGEEFVKRGLFWTAVGIAGLIAWLILERMWSWWRIRSAQNSTRPVPTTSVPLKTQHPDDSALESLLAEAEHRLAESATFRGNNTRILDLPMYLLLGAEGAGKTSVLEASGMEPVLLAGQIAGGSTSVGPTRLANIWLAKETLYLEISGRIFGGDLTRFIEFVECLRARPVLSPFRQRIAKTRWAKWFEVPSPPPKLRGVLLFFSAREFTGTPELAKIERATQQIRERLDAVAAHFGTGCPVYVIFTKTDAVPFYQDFFSRFSETEAGQVFGVLNSPDLETMNSVDRVWAEAESRRFGKYFNRLFLRLSDRRLLALATEVQPYQKPAVYEFPREFKRIRDLLVQFLVDVFKPNPLKASPVLRGFFFSGTRQVERSAAQPKREVTERVRPSSLEVTNIFRSGATEIFSPAMIQAALAGRGQNQLVTSWMFVTDFFHKVLTQDRPLPPAPARTSTSPNDRYGPWIFGATATIGFLAAIVWTTSWFSNRNAISETIRLIEENNRLGSEVSLQTLHPLDQLRNHIEDLKKNDSWMPHWGLYTGNQVYRLARMAYFRRLKSLLLEGTNATLIARLQSPNKGSLYESLKAHITISKNGCPAEPSLNSILGGALQEWKPGLGSEHYELADRQLRYYTATFIAENQPPAKLLTDDMAIGKAQEFLRNDSGLDQQLNTLLNQVGKLTSALKVQDRIPEYTKVLSGPSEIPGQFTKAGSQLMDQLIDKGSWSSGEDCVTGNTRSRIGGLRDDADTKKRLSYLYYSKYAEVWKTFLGSFRVLAFAGAGDAATKLERISGPQSPLLGLVKLVSENTNFPEKAGEVSQWEGYAEKFGLASLLQKKKAAEKAVDQIDQAMPKPAGLTSRDVALLFQPAHATTPPALPVLVSEGNQAYITGLRTLQQQLEAYSHASGSEERSSLIPQARSAVSAAESSLNGLADKFANIGNQGLNVQLTSLLRQPIQFADKMIPLNAKAPLLGKMNGDLAGTCSALAPTLRKYPFNAQGSTDASLEEIAKAFAPKKGRVWQYQQALGELVVRQGPDWIAGPPKPQATQGLLTFFNHAQKITDAFFAPNNTTSQPRLTYSLRPAAGQSQPIHLVLDGKDMNSAVSKLRTVFEWPAPPGAIAGATAEQGSSDFPRPFGQYDGIWGVFRFFQYADKRGLEEKRVQWSEVRGRGGASPQRLSPPAAVDFVDFPGGVDLFNPKFFETLRCPSQAVQQE